MADITVDQVVSAILKLRGQKTVLDAEHKENTKKITDKIDKLESWIRVKADKDGVTSFKTKFGTAFLTTVDYANVENWDAVLNFIRENEAFDMLERRVSKTAVRSYIDTYKEVPAGVTYRTAIEVNVRKPAKKVE